MSMNRAVIWRCTSEGVRASSTACSRAASCWAAKDWVSERNCAGALLESASSAAPPAPQNLEDDDAQRVHVRPAVVLGLAAGLLRCHIAGSPHHDACAGQVTG